MAILLTGFEPFGGEPINPSWELARAWQSEQRHALCVPVVYARAWRQAVQAIETLKPDAVLMFGQSGGAATTRVERVAINLEHTTTPDNAGDIANDRPVIPDAPAAHFSTVPVSSLVSRLQQAGVPAQESLSAGSFVCNSLFFGVMHAVHSRFPHIRAGFFHIPYLPEQAAQHPGSPSMGQDILRQAMKVILEMCANSAPD